MKQRKFKFSLGIKIASILSCLALVSIGFASWWVININKPAAASTGSFTVYEVEEKNVNITVDGNNGWTGAEIIFGKPVSTTVNPTWLLANDPNMKNQSLSATLKFSVSTDKAGDKIGDFVNKVTVTFDLSKAEVTIPANTPGFDNQNQHTMTFAALFKHAMDKGYIAAPKISGTYGTNGTIAEVSYDGTNALTVEITDLGVQTMDVTLNFDFGWGTLTGGENPFDYFNDPNKISYSTETKNKALAMLTAIDLLGDVQDAYSVTIDATVKGAN